MLKGYQLASTDSDSWILTLALAELWIADFLAAPKKLCYSSGSLKSTRSRATCSKSIQLATLAYPPLIPMLPAWTSMNPTNLFFLVGQGLVLALCGGAGAEYRVHPGHAGVQWGGGEPGQVYGRGRELAGAGEEAHRGADRTGIQLGGHPGAKPPPALQHPTDCLLGHEHGPQRQGEKTHKLNFFTKHKCGRRPKL